MARGKQVAAPHLGYKPGFAEAYELQRELGRGGNGVVRSARNRATGRTVAVKSIPKVLDDPNASERKKAGQIPYLKREVEVLLALRGSLDVIHLQEVYEDSTHVHLVLELCSGGELLARTKGARHYSERTAASFLRAILRTLAQCHAKRIIHRDVKPENFLFLTNDEASPLKAIDFGLAVYYDPQQLPVTGLNPEGTPWYLAPECCRAKWYPVSDVWAAGVMACYLLTGAYPFLDRISPKMPDLARTLRCICFEELDLSGKEFQGLSEEAQAFIQALLVKDPLQRPSAEEALRHPFLRGNRRDRAAGNALDKTVVQRIQRFGQSSLFKRTVLEHIAADLLSMHFRPDPSSHGASVFRERSVKGGMAYHAAIAERSGSGALEGSTHSSTHGGGSSMHAKFKAAASAALAAVRLERSVHGGSVGGGRSAEGSRRGGSVHGGSRWGGHDMEGSRRGGSVHGGSRWGGRDAEGSRRGGSVHGGSRWGGRDAEGSRWGGSVHGGSRWGGRDAEGSRRGGAAALVRAASNRSLAASTGGLPEGSVRSASLYLPVATPYSNRLAQLFDQLDVKPGQKIDRQKLQQALQQIGYHLQEAEVEELFEVVDVEHRGEVSRVELAAGLIDWKAFQDTYKDRWLECARRAFMELDPGGRGQLGAAEIAAAFGSHLSPYEVDAAVHQALLEATSGAAAVSVGSPFAAATAAPGAGAGDAGGSVDEGMPPIDFEHFLNMLRTPSGAMDDLELFEDRLGTHPSRLPSLTHDDLAPVKRQQRGVGQEGPPVRSCCAIS